jgi:DNA-binding NarL/FixJ family response regulator
MTVRVMIVDDHTFYRDGLRAALEADPGIEVVAEAGNAQQAITLAAEALPNVITMDLSLGDHPHGMDGIQATRAILSTQEAQAGAERVGELAILILSMHQDDDYVFGAMRAGARGFLLKDAGKNEITRAVLAVANGEAVFAAAIWARALRFLSEAPAEPKDPALLFPQLTEREREVFGHIATGRTNTQIATAIYASPKTIRNHVSNILMKLQIADRTTLAIRGRDAGLHRQVPN